MYSSRQYLGDPMSVLFLCISSSILIAGIMLSKMKTKTRYHTTLALAWLVFSYKMIEYSIYALNFRLEKIPIEFSTITYFIFSITVIFNLRSFKTIAAFMSFVTGIGYLVSFVFLGQSFFAQNGAYITSMALLNHSIVYLGSMMMIKDVVWNHQEERRILIFSVLYIIYVAVLDMFVSFTQPFIFIRMLLGADVLYRLLPQSTYSSYMYLLYYLVIFLMFRFIMFLFHIICSVNDRKEVRHEHTI